MTSEWTEVTPLLTQCSHNFTYLTKRTYFSQLLSDDHNSNQNPPTVFLLWQFERHKLDVRTTSFVSEPHAIYPSETDRPTKFCRKSTKLGNKVYGCTTATNYPWSHYLDHHARVKHMFCNKKIPECTILRKRETNFFSPVSYRLSKIQKSIVAFIFRNFGLVNRL